MSEGDGAYGKSARDRIARIEGQIKGIRRMMENDEYCIDVLNQIQSVQQALRGLTSEIMEEHLSGCVKEGIQSDDPRQGQEKIEEFMTTLDRFMKAIVKN